MISAEATRFLAACAFLRSSGERLRSLRESLPTEGLDEGFVRALELHGILPLAARNLRDAEVELPEEVATRLAEREKALREEGLRDGLTVDRLLAAAGKVGIPVVLLKGASLACDLYDDPLVRSQGDVDVLVEDQHVRPLVEAAVEAGLVESEAALPIWWHRSTHFHLKLEPTAAMLKEVEVHWRLHHPSLLLSVDHGGLFARAREITVGSHAAWTLDPVDRFLHLITHLASHWVHLPSTPTMEVLLEWLAADPPRIRLKWFVDIVAAVEQLAPTTKPEVVRKRAAAWGAGQQVAFVLSVVRTGFGLSPEVVGWLEALAPGSAQASTDSSTNVTSASRPLPGLDFRREALSLWPRWFWPNSDYWQAREPGSSGVRLLFKRSLHAGGVLAQSLRAGVAFPAALLSRPFLRGGRRRRRAAAMAPERVLDLVTAWKRLPR